MVMRQILTDLHLLIITNIKAKVIVGVILYIVSFFFDLLLAKVFLILLFLTFLDCVLGYVRATTNKTAIVSKLMKAYMWRFIGYTTSASVLFLIAQGMPKILYVDTVVGMLDDIALAFFIIHEGTSVIEHLNQMGVPMPKKLFYNLYKIKGEVNDPQDQYKASLK